MFAIVVDRKNFVFWDNYFLENPGEMHNEDFEASELDFGLTIRIA